MDELKISLRENPDDEITEIRADGVIDTLTAVELEEVVDRLMKRRRFKIVVDLAGIDYISSAGWGIFISHIKDIRDGKGDIKLAGMIPNVYEIYDLLEFDNVLKAYPSVDDARQDFGARRNSPDVKKKETRVTEVAVRERHPAGLAIERVSLEPGERVIDPGATDLETMALRMVKNDPFASIGEIKFEIRRHSPSLNPTWWQVFAILREKRLLTKRSRFRFFRS